MAIVAGARSCVCFGVPMEFNVDVLNFRLRSVLLLAGLLAAPGGCTRSGVSRAIPETTPGGRPAFASVEELVVERTNSSRMTAGTASVRPNSQLSQAARGFAEYMARTGRFEHHADGRNVLVRAKSAGYEAQVICENLYQCTAPAGITTQELAEAAIDGWMHSDGHRRSLLEKRVHEIGVGVAGDPASGRYYVVEILARPRRMSNLQTRATH